MKIRKGFIKCSCGYWISTRHKIIKCCICGRIWKQHGCFYLSRKEKEAQQSDALRIKQEEKAKA